MRAELQEQLYSHFLRQKYMNLSQNWNTLRDHIGLHYKSGFSLSLYIQKTRINLKWCFKIWNMFLVQLSSHLKDKQITSSWLDNWVKYQVTCHIVLQYNLHEVNMYVWGTIRKTVIVCILVEFCAFCDTLWIFPCWASPIKAASLSINMFPWNALNSQSTSPSHRIILVENMIWRFLGNLELQSDL